MEDMEKFVNGFKPKVSIRDDVTGRLGIFRKLKKDGINKSSNYFIISELVLPADSIIAKKFGKEKDKKLEGIFAQGNKIHAIVQNWLKQHKEYCGSESVLDGIFIGLPVRGRVDGRINETIVEIKSIKDLPENEQEIINKHPQYIEQIAFYSVIDPLTPKENELIFVEKEYPYRVKSFKLEILDNKAIENVLRKRMHLFKSILENKEKSDIFGKCRYCFEEECSVKDNEQCELLGLEPLGCEVKDYIKLSEDKEFTSEIENLKKMLGENYKFYSPYVLICPRKYCLEELYGRPEEDFKKTNSADKAYFGNLVYHFRNSEKFVKGDKKSNFSEFKLNKYNWFNDRTSMNPDGKEIPFIAHVTDYFDPDKPSPYKIAELGLYLMAHGLNKGMIFIYYPKEDKIKVFEIQFDFKGDYLSEIRKIIRGLENPESFLSLPKCPEWLCRKCVFVEKCR